MWPAFFIFYFSYNWEKEESRFGFLVIWVNHHHLSNIIQCQVMYICLTGAIDLFFLLFLISFFRKTKKTAPCVIFFKNTYCSVLAKCCRHFQVFAQIILSLSLLSANRTIISLAGWFFFKLGSASKPKTWLKKQIKKRLFRIHLSGFGGHLVIYHLILMSIYRLWFLVILVKWSSQTDQNIKNKFFFKNFSS